MLHTLAVAAALITPQVNVPQLLADEIREVRPKTELTILLPERMPDLFDEYFPTAEGHRRRYAFEVGAAPGCGGSTACFVADFSARKGGRPFGKRRVTLARGRVGWFQPISCGASCSPPSMSWKERGATYDLQAKLEGGGRRTLTRMANSAIRQGPR